MCNRNVDAPNPAGEMQVQRVLISCVGAIAAAAIVGSLVFRTMRNESKPHPTSNEAVLSAGDSKTGVLDAFKTQKSLEQYLIAGAEHDANALKKVEQGADCVRLPNGTHAIFQGYSGAGMGKVRVLSGAHAGEELYVSFLVIQQSGGSGQQ